ncbi:xanthine dehydrogenase family protein, partial [bacterium]|nr:xanthine dehydrogenase family protein [candidate division CSSED10-310 bacterium]
MKVVGKPVHRLDAVEKVTGRLRYAADVWFPNCLSLKVVRSTQARAVLKMIDTAAALAVPGVVAVVTGAGVPGLVGDCVRDQPPLAHGQVRFAGEPVAVVIAVDQGRAEAAAKLVRIDYDPLPVLLDADQAMAPEAPIIHERNGSYEVVPAIHPREGTNIAHHFKIRKGHVAEALASAAHTFRQSFTIPHITHAALEPHTAVACWEPDGSLWVVSSSQSPHLVRKTLAELFGISIAAVDVIAPPLGGGFGGKSDHTIEPLVAAAARAVPGRPVRLVLEREEVFTGTVLGRGCRADIETGFDAMGRLMAARIRLRFAIGAYANNAVNVADGAGHNALGPYNAPNVDVDSFAVYTNTPPVGAFRGYGHPEVHWMLERHMEHVARAMGIDSVALRLRNLISPGDANAFGQVIHAHDGDPRAALRLVDDTLTRELGEYTPAPGARVGRGLAAMVKSPVMAANAVSSATMRVNDDGSVDLVVSASEMGQGSVTALSQIAAEGLQVPLEMVRINRTIRTRIGPYEWQTVASSTTWKVGNAILDACRTIVTQARKNAALAWGVEVADVRYEAGKLSCAENGMRLDLAATARGCFRADGSVVGAPLYATGSYVPKGLTAADPDTGQGRLAASWTFGCQGCLVEVDPVTGKVTIPFFISVLDVGAAINPELARQQVMGAVVQGVGAAFLEEIVYDGNGRIRNHSFTDY